MPSEYDNRDCPETPLPSGERLAEGAAFHAVRPSPNPSLAGEGSEKPTAGLLRLFEAYPALGAASPWVSIGQWPTPVTDARHFSERHELGQLFVKREDLSHPECGGNKVRGLEFLLADARARGADTLLTFGVTGSHHICRTAWHAARMGIRTTAIVVGQPHAPYVDDHLEIARRAGAEYLRLWQTAALPKAAWHGLKLRLLATGRRSYFVPAGGTTMHSCLGHVNAGLELARQVREGVLPEPDYLYVAMGSLGTAAGLLVGLRLAGLQTHIVGVVTSHRWFATAGRWLRMARRIHALMQRYDASVPDVQLDRRSISVIDTALGKGYARKTEASVRLADEFEADEGIRLDTTYTAKALHGMMQTIAARGTHDAVHLFWNTYHRMTPDG